MKLIKLILICFSFLMSLAVVTGCQTTSQSPYEDVGPVVKKSVKKSVMKGCETELKTYCSKVIPGEGRVIACLYGSHEKLSGECNQALTNAQAQLEKFDQGVGYASIECEDDIKKHCNTVIPGEGRILTCLFEEKRDVVSNRWIQAINKAGLDLEYLELPDSH